MNSKELTTVLSSWLRIPKNNLSKTMTKLKKLGIAPENGMQNLSVQNTSEIIIGIMACCLSISQQSDWVHYISKLELEGPLDVDPLDVQARVPFVELVKKTGSVSSGNGYVSFSETLAMSFVNQDANIGIVEIEAINVHVYGDVPVATIDVFYDGSMYKYSFTQKGHPVEKDGLCQTICLNKGVIHGMGWIVKSEVLLSRSI